MPHRYPGTRTQLWWPGTLWVGTAATGPEARERAPGFTFRGLLGVHGAPPAGCALSPCRCRHQREPGPLCPAPGRQATPPGARTRLPTPALFLQIQAGPVGFLLDLWRAAAATTTVVLAAPLLCCLKSLLLLMPQARTSQIAKTVPPPQQRRELELKSAPWLPIVDPELGRKEIVGPHLSATES